MESVIKLPLLKPTTYSQAHTHTQQCLSLFVRTLVGIMQALIPETYRTHRLIPALSLALASLTFKSSFTIMWTIRKHPHIREMVLTGQNCCCLVNKKKKKGFHWAAFVINVYLLFFFACVCISAIVLNLGAISYPCESSPTRVLAGTDMKEAVNWGIRPRFRAEREERQDGSLV